MNAENKAPYHPAGDHSGVTPCGGINIRAELAARAMQGLISSIGYHDLIAADEIAYDSVVYADALITALNAAS